VEREGPDNLLSAQQYERDLSSVIALSLIYDVRSIIIIIIIIIILLLPLLFFFYYFGQGISSFIPPTNHVSKVCSVAAILLLQFMANAMLFQCFFLLLLLT
jgi:hypothetical protein